MNKIKKGDIVVVIAGKDKNRKGAVLTVLPCGSRVIVEGINTVKKHVKQNQNTGDRGGIVMKTLPIHRSNVMLHNSSTDKRSRVGIRKLEDGTEVRYFKSNDEVIDQ